MRECCICYENVMNPVFLPCSHFLCENCLVKLEQSKCPFCREFFDFSLARNLQKNFSPRIFPGDYIYLPENKKIKVKFRKRRKDKIIIVERNKNEIIVHEKIKLSTSQKRNINSGKNNKRKGSWSCRNYF